MKIAILIISFFSIAAKATASEECHLREIDLCASTGMFHFQKNGVPSDEEQLNEWCETVKEISECSGNYSAKCLSPLQRELIGLFTGGGADLRIQLCTPGTEIRSRYMKHAECLSNLVESDSAKSHIRDLQVSVESISDVPFKNRLTTLCCGFRRFEVECKQNTGKTCGEDSIEMLNFIVDMAITELPRTLCRSYDPSSSECQRLLPPVGTVPKGTKSQSQIGKLMGTVFDQ